MGFLTKQSDVATALGKLTSYASVMDLRIIIVIYNNECQVLFDKALLKRPDGTLQTVRGTGRTIEAASQSFIGFIRGKELQVGSPPGVTTISVPTTL